MLENLKLPSFGHPKLLGRYFDHVYHQSWNIGHLTRKVWDKSTGYNEAVYNQELSEVISHIWGIGELDHSPWHKPVPTSLLNPEIILPEPTFKAAFGHKEGWMDESWMCSGEIPGLYVHDDLEAWLDWNGKDKELQRPKDNIDKIDHKAMYLEDYPDDMPDLKNAEDLSSLVYNRSAATPASTTVSTDT